jgi:protein TonB
VESTPPTASNPPTVVATPVPISNAAANPAKTEASKASVVREVSPSAPISKDLPAYPETARRMKIEGKVDVDAQVDEQGKVVTATAINGHVLLQDAAVEAVKKWKFKPAALNGKNVPSSSRVSVVFRLHP